VTLVTSGRFFDMWIQDPVGDGDPTTSDGIFVDDAYRLDPLPKVGDLVRVTGDVEEQQFGNALPLTRIDDPHKFDYEVLSEGNPLPAPVPLVDLPNWSMAEGEAFWEPLEGMRVSITNGFVVAATNGFGEFGMLTKEDADADLDSGYFAQIKQILIQSLGMVEDDYVVDYNPERIMVDDRSVEDAISVSAGDRVRSLTGVVDYTFSNYKLQPDTFDVFNHKAPKMPVSKRTGGFGNFTITTYNIENLFDMVDNPDKDDGSSTPDSQEELDIQLAKLALSIEVELDLPEIIVVQETENQAILQELGDLVNDANGTAYTAVSFETSDGRGIEVGFLYDANRTTLLDAFQMEGEGVDEWFGPDSPSPGREPLVGVFEIMNREVTIIGNHFKSKGGDDPLYGVNWPANRVTEVQRKGQAGVVRDFVNVILDDDPDALVMVAGDLNDFQCSEPGEGPDNPVAIVAGRDGEVPLVNLATLEKPPETFSFVFDGNSQLLDHILVSPGLYEYFRAVDILHFNNVAPTLVYDQDPTTTLEASDHDPVEARFLFE
jgi:predicted extracellular nuclease